MINATEMYDLLIVESSPVMIEMFSEISRIFKLKILIAKDINEFVKLVTKNEFKFVFANLHIEYNFAGIFIKRMYTNIRKIKSKNGKMFVYSLQNNENYELAKLELNDFAEQKYDSFYEFLEGNFPQNFFQYFKTDEFKQSIPAAI